MSENSKEETMKANTAATKIQANFRGYRVRKQLKETTTTNGAKSHHQQRDNNQQQRRYQHQQHRRRNNERESSDAAIGAKSLSSLERQNTSREALEEKSATKIQAGIRGFLVRKRQQAAQAAATRIQAGFRGFRTRKLLKQNGQ